MSKSERRQLQDILLKMTPMAVAYATGKMTGASGLDPVQVPMQMIEECADGMRDLKLMLFPCGEADKYLAPKN